MAPILRPRTSLTADKFPGYFQQLRSQKYDDEPNSRKERSPYHIRTIAWNPIGTLVATGAVDKSLRVWNPEKPYAKFSTELKGHQSSVEKIAWNPTKDAELCSVSSDGVVKFWDVRTKTCFNEVKGLDDAFTLVWSPDGETLIVGNKHDNLFILSPSSPTPLSSHQQTHQTNQIAFCPSGTKIFVTTAEGRVRILSYPDFEPLLHLPGGEGREYMLDGHTSACMSVELQPTGRHLATGGADSVIALWDTENWLCRRTVTGLAGMVRVISFTFDGSYVVGGSDDGTGLDVTHVESGQTVHTFKTASSCPVVAWAPTRYCLAYTDMGILRIVGLDTDRMQ